MRAAAGAHAGALLLLAVPALACRPREHVPLAPLVPLDRGARWELGAGPLGLWIQPRAAPLAGARHPRADYTRAVAEAAQGWRGIVRGLRFVPARDSASATVRVVWRRTLDPPARGRARAPTAGRTTLAVTADGRAVTALVELALHATPTAPYAPADVRIVAQHELGHVLGLAHHASRASIMAAEPTVTTGPSRSDRDALRKKYGAERSVERRASRD